MDWHTVSSELVDWFEKIAANLKPIEKASGPENLISGKLGMRIHSQQLARLPEGKVQRLSPETNL